MTDILRRALAPIADAGWSEIERQSASILKRNLSGRRLVDFRGPHGLAFAAVNLGRLDLGAGPAVDGIGWGLHRVLPLVEIRVPFTLGIWDLDDLERGARNPNLAPLAEAARKVALFEERALYRGFSACGIQGLLEVSVHAPVPVGPDRKSLPESVERAILAIQGAEIGGPFALVLGTELFKGVLVGDPDAYPLRRRIEALASGGIHWSPVLEGGAVLSTRGGDFEMTVGQDIAVGYQTHDARDVNLYFAESFTFRVLEPAAAVELKVQDGG